MGKQNKSWTGAAPTLESAACLLSSLPTLASILRCPRLSCPVSYWLLIDSIVVPCPVLPSAAPFAAALLCFSI